jgi:ribosomal-protein-alanine N-acetyltransferase
MGSRFEVRVDSVTLREYRPADLEAMYALDVLCFQPPFRFSRRAMRGFAEAPSSISVLAHAEGELVGFCVADFNERTGYVVTLDVAPAWRRRGLARRLMIEIETKVRAASGLGMELHVFKGNLGAIHFYESLGYDRVAIAAGFYGRGLDALVYRKRFEP